MNNNYIIFIFYFIILNALNRYRYLENLPWQDMNNAMTFRAFLLDSVTAGEDPCPPVDRQLSMCDKIKAGISCPQV